MEHNESGQRFGPALLFFLFLLLLLLSSSFSHPFQPIAIHPRMPEYNFETVKVTFPAPFVAHVELNRPKKMNAIDGQMWEDIRSVFDTLRDDENVRSIVLSGSGRCFTSGLDSMLRRFFYMIRFFCCFTDHGP